MTSDFTIDEGAIPQDEAPDFTPTVADPSDSSDPRNWYNPDYPYSSEEHPYGYFTGSDGSPDFDRPRKRRPHGARKDAGTGVTKGYPATEKQARAAAKLLAQMNLFIGMGLYAAGLHQTAQELKTANEQFEEMAFNALLADPKLCSKILSAGATSGKAQLTMAYLALGGSLAPLAWQEIKSVQASRTTEEEFAA
jgi:hypothetical protein